MAKEIRTQELGASGRLSLGSRGDEFSLLRTIVGALQRWWTVGRRYRPERRYMRGSGGRAESAASSATAERR